MTLPAETRTWRDAEIEEYAYRLASKDQEIGRLRGELREANRQIINVNDSDCFSFDGYTLKVHEECLTGTVKAELRLNSHFQLKAALREILESTMELDEKDDKTCLDMGWVWSD